MPSKSEDQILGIDIGTSSIRGGLFDDRAGPVGIPFVKREYSIDTTRDGGSEIEAARLFDLVIEVIDEIHAQTDRPIEHIASCSFWHSLMGVDFKGEPTTKLFTWADTRSREYTAKLRERFDEDQVHNRTGARFHSSFWPAKLLWIKNSFKESFARTAKWLSFSDFVAMKLCQRSGLDSLSPSILGSPHDWQHPGVPITSLSMASATGVFNISELRWDADLLDHLGLHEFNFSGITSNDQARFLNRTFASRWPKLKNVCWFPTIGDGAANNIGSHSVTKNRATLMVGTSGAMRVAFKGAPPTILPDGLWSYRVDEKRMIVGGALSDGGGLYAYLKKTLNVEVSDEAIGEEIARRGADVHGLTVLPFFFGERSTGYNEDARGHVLGLSDSHDSVDIIHAAMEAVAFRFAEIFDQLKNVAKIEQIVVAGGALDQSPVWTQIIADVLGRDLLVSNEPEASLRGAVLLALESLGKIDSIDSVPQEKHKIAFHPKCHAIYKKARKRHVSAYNKLFIDNK